MQHTLISTACRYQKVNKTHQIIKTNLQEEYQKYHKNVHVCGGEILSH
jgi:hypothetical protein